VGCRTLWAIAGLVIIPTVLVGLAFGLNHFEAQRQTDVELERSQAAAYQAYLHVMADLMKEGLAESELYDPKRNLARAWTLTVLLQLDAERKGLLLRFLKESFLTEGRVVDLRGADFSGADLRKADLFMASLEGFDLSGADLRGAWMNWASLTNIDLSGADLRGADMRDVTLTKVDLTDAKVTREQLNMCVLKETIMPDGTMHE
jgi:hypothetical protein